MKLIRFFLIGTFFGIVLTKSEAISWFRIQEMFRFDSFHMYGIIGVAVIATAVLIQLMQRYQMRSVDKEPLKLKVVPVEWRRLLFGGTIFGLGWALTGACPGPLYILVGHGYLVILVVIGMALLGTLTYGALRDKLPH
jgi:uncharacterized protein